LRPHERLPQQERVRQQPLDPPGLSRRRGAEPELAEAAAVAVHQRADAERLDEAAMARIAAIIGEPE